MKKLCSVLFISIVLVSEFFAQKSSDRQQNVSKVEKTMPYTKGLNLSGWLEAYGNSNASSERFGRQDFEDIKSLGVEIVRVPVWFEEYSSGKPDYIIEEWLWEKIDSAVEWCTELKMYMIIDFHNNCGGDSKTNPDIEKILLKIWPQIAKRYKDSGEYVLYEIMNEPHMKSGNVAADVAKWNKIQGNVLKKIREIDKTHTVIVGAEDWNSIGQLSKLPDYNDSNIILNFHDYSPFLFTHQGASWTQFGRVTGIPFPYIKEKMPPLPKNPTNTEKWAFQDYPQASKEETLVKPLDEAVKFANSRGVALMCNEWGVQMNYADDAERVNWYRLKAKWMDERNIIRLSWDYNNSFGIFNKTGTLSGRARFPEDLNTGIVEAMGFTVPHGKSKPYLSWFENAGKTGNYTIYKNGFVKGVYSGGGVNGTLRINKIDSDDKTAYIYIAKADPWNSFQCIFDGTCDFTDLVNSGKALEFEIRSNQKGLNISVYFMDKETAGTGKGNLAWRCQTPIREKLVPADGKWHKVRVPLKEFYDSGAWDGIEQKWYNPEDLFSWKKVDRLTFDFGEKGLQKDVSIRNIEIK